MALSAQCARAHGIVKLLVDHLRGAAACDALDGPATATLGCARCVARALPRSVALVDVLHALSAALQDVDTSLEFAGAGGHALLAALLSKPPPACGDVDVDDATADALAAAVSAATASLPRGLQGFPLPRTPAFVGLPPPRVFSLGSFLHAPSYDACVFAPLAAPALQNGVPAVDRALEQLLVRVRTVPLCVRRQASQEDVGAALWPCALPMARWLVAHRAWLSGRSVLELGSGVGLCGIVAAVFAAGCPAARVVLSDFSPSTLDALTYNVKLNEGRGGDDDDDDNDDDNDKCLASRALPRGVSLSMCVRRLDFNDRVGAHKGAGVCESDSTPHAPLPDGAIFDIIIASDVICCDADAESLAAVLDERLAVCGVAVFFSPPPEARYGVAAFADAVRAQGGLRLEVRTLHADFLGARYAVPELAAVAEPALAGSLPVNDGTATAVRLLQEGAQEADDATIASGYEQRTCIFVVSRL